MLSRDLRFTGFTADSWLNLLSLLGVGDQPHARPWPENPEHEKQGTVVVVENPDGSPCAAFHTTQGSILPDSYLGRADLPALCERHLALRGVVVRRGAIEELTERAAPRVIAAEDYAAQWLALQGAARELEREGLLHFWPPRSSLPLPSPVIVARALDIVLPDEHSFVLVVWERTEIWTALVLRRRGSQIDLIAGPELLLDVSGPLGGDYRRDHRTLREAISQAIAPVHIGVFVQRDRLIELLRNPQPGAWAKAFAVRDVIIDPAPPYVHVALGADTLRASGRKASEWLGGLDFLAALEPITRVVRDQVAQVTSVSGLLGWNPLQVLAQRLRNRDRH